MYIHTIQLFGFIFLPHDQVCSQHSVCSQSFFNSKKKIIIIILLICPTVAEWREQTIHSTCILTAGTQSSLNYLLISKGTISSFRMATYKKLAQQQQQSCTKNLQYGTRGLDSSWVGLWALVSTLSSSRGQRGWGVPAGHSSSSSVTLNGWMEATDSLQGRSPVAYFLVKNKNPLCSVAFFSPLHPMSSKEQKYNQNQNALII